MQRIRPVVTNRKIILARSVCMYVCFRVLCCVVCVFVFSSHKSLDVPVGVTQEEGRTGFLIHLPSAARALMFLARRAQPFLSLVDREVGF